MMKTVETMVRGAWGGDPEDVGSNFTADTCPPLIGMEGTESKDTNPWLRTAVSKRAGR